MKLILKSMNLAIMLFAVCIFALAPLTTHAQDAPAQDTHGIVVGNMDRAVKPGDNFFEYANGEWIKRTVIPPDRARIGVFSTLADLSDKRTAALIEEAAKGKLSNGRKVADLYNSYMDETTIETKGLAPLHPHLDAIAAIKSKTELATALGET